MIQSFQCDNSLWQTYDVFMDAGFYYKSTVDMQLQPIPVDLRTPKEMMQDRLEAIALEHSDPNTDITLGIVNLYRPS